MERPIFKPIGTPAEELDTPALVVDLDILDRNIKTMASFFADRKAKLRPHVEPHRTPAIAHRQLAAGGTVGGICVTTLGEAETFAASGISDIFVANVIVTPQKLSRLCALALQSRVTVATDSAANVKSLSEAACASGVTLDVVVNVNTRLGIFGVAPGKPAVDVAKAVAGADGLNFAGLMTYEGVILEDTKEKLEAESRKWLQQLLNTRQDVEKAGLDVRVVSAGGTYNYEIAGATDGITEVPAGAYALMEERYRKHRPQFQPAARVVATVTGTPEEGLLITDGGQKAIGSDNGMPSVDNIEGATVRSLSAEHGSIVLGKSNGAKFSLGDKVWHTPYDIGNCVNLHDYMSVVKGGRLVAVWEIPARGRYR